MLVVFYQCTLQFLSIQTHLHQPEAHQAWRISDEKINSETEKIEGWELVGGWTNPFIETYATVKLDHFPRDPGENSKNIWVATT